MTVKMKLINKMPRKLDIVCKPRIDAVGRDGAKRAAGLAKGSVKAKEMVQTPSMKTQHHSVNVT
jgi:hypothetical protein